MMENILENDLPMDRNDKASDRKAFENDAANREFTRLAKIYSWDMRIQDAVQWPERLLRRVMDIGALEDIVSMENAIGRKPLVNALRSAEIGALRPRSWSFWHHRLDLVKTDGECPPYPIRRFA